MTSAGNDLSSCLQRLPVELAHKILSDAALLGLAYDRTWAVSLARVSSTVRHVVEPILHRTIVVGIHNAAMIEALGNDSCSTHVFNSVKRFILTFLPGSPTFSNGLVATAPVDFDISHLLIYLTSLESVDAPYDILRRLVLVRTVRLRRLALRFSALYDITKLADGSLSHVTHLEGWLPSQFTHFVPRDWVLAILAAVPALTHIAFNIAAADLRSDPRQLEGDVDTLPDIIRPVLERKAIQRVVLHLPRDRISNWPMFKATLTRFNDSRIYVWRDDRVIDMWEGNVERVAEEDAWAARNVWTEARPWDH